MTEIYKCEAEKRCSGCRLLRMSYQDQLKYKQTAVVRRLGRFCRVERIIGMENPLHYRNKVQAAFTYKNGKTVSGVYQSARRAVVPMDSCMLEDENADRIIVTIRRLCESFRIPPMDYRTGRGFLRYVAVRKGFKTGEIMVVLVTAEGEFRCKRDFLAELLESHPEITTVVRNISSSDKILMLGEREEVLYGDGYITEELLGLRFRISPKSFFQVNPVQTEALYKKAIELAGLSGKERVVDAYCGTGTIGLSMAKNAKEVLGAEINRDSIADAKKNAELNGITNVRFFAADAGKFMDELSREGERVDVVVCDPPRAGCSPRFLKSLITLSPKKIVYVSCNPETLARDLYTLRNADYKVKHIQPVDMFPFTEHIECVVCLSR